MLHPDHKCKLLLVMLRYICYQYLSLIVSLIFFYPLKQMVKMMITVVALYAFCWLPLHTVTLLDDFYGLYNWPYSRIIWLMCHWLAMSNCCTNPIVYCWMNARYRYGFKRIFRHCPFINFRIEDDPNMRRPTGWTTVRSSARVGRHMDVNITTLSTPKSNCNSVRSSHERIPLTKMTD